MGAAARRAWSSVVRQDVVESVAALLENNGVEGVVVSGAAGTGKTALARAVERRLGRGTHFLHLYGKRTSDAVPFGQFDFLLARMPAAAASSPGAIVSHLSDLILEDAQGRSIVVVVDDMPAMDNMSTAVLMHLMLSGTASVLVLVRHVADLPEDLAWRLKDHLMRQVHLEEFSRDEVLELLTGTLGQVVSATAVSTLHAASRGNPLVLQALVAEQLRSGNLQLQGNVWALKGRVSVDSAQTLSEVVRARLALESKAVREALEHLAMLRRTPLAVLVELWGPDVVTELESAGYLAIERDGRHWVELADAYLGEVLRGWMNEDRRRDVYQRISSAVGPDPGRLEREDVLSFALWSLDGGVPVEPGIALAAARSAMDLFDPELALKCAQLVSTSEPEWVAAAQLRAKAHIAQSNPALALAALQEATAGQLDALTAAEYGSYMVDLCRVLVRLPGGEARIAEVLGGAEEHMSALALSSDDDEDLGEGADQLRLARFAAMVHAGDFAAARTPLEDAHRTGAAESFRLNCGALLSIVWAMTGQELDAVVLAKEVLAAAREADLRLAMAAEVQQGMYLGLLFSGDWRACTVMLRRVLEEAGSAMDYVGGATELALGVAYTYAGHGSLALGLLMGARAQQEARGSLVDPVLVHSALAFAYAQLDDAAAARRHLDLAESGGTPAEWVVGSMAKFCNLMARRWLQEPGAKQKLIESAREDLAQGRLTAASTSLFGATVHGTDEEFALLESISAQRQGSMARINVLTAIGSRTKDVPTLLEAAETARGLGLDAVESRALVLATDIARERHSSTLARSAQQRLDELTERLPLLPLAPHTHGPELTGRERQIAKMASQGLSNREMAAALDVSVRTVEGHLYQIFTKLGISSRADLEGPVHV